MNLQLAPSTHLPARPSNRPPAFAFRRSSGPAFKPNLRLSSVAASVCSAFRPLSGLRLRSIFQLNLPTSLRLSPSIDLPAQPLLQPSACTAGLYLRSNRCANHRLAPLAGPPIEPLCQPSACASGRPSGCAFRPVSDFRRLPTFQLRLPDGLRLSPIANLQALPTNPTSDSHRLLRLPASPSGQSWTCVFDQPSGYLPV